MGFCDKGKMILILVVGEAALTSGSDLEARGEVSTVGFVKDSGRYGTSRDNDGKLPACGPTGKQRIRRGRKSASEYVPCNSSAELEALHISRVTVNPVNVIGKKLASTLPQFT